MNPVTLQITIAVGGFLANALFAMWFVRWRKREAGPEKEIADLRDQIVKLRESVARINGRLNGHGWKRGEA